MLSKLQELKKNQEAQLAALRQQASSQDKTTKAKDERWWKPTTDAAGNGVAVFRFLPGPEGETAWAKYYDYSFKGPTGKSYWERSLNTIGQKDPVQEFNTSLWNTQEPDKIEQARKQGRKENYVSNILVINDPANPENNGKVFLYRYGKKIYENKIKAIMFPDEISGDAPENPFDFWNGRNFQLVIKKVSDFPNYDNSKFLKNSPVAATDEEIEAIWAQCHSLKEFTDPTKFKTYDELKARLEEVLEIGTTNTKSAIEASRIADLSDSLPVSRDAVAVDASDVDEEINIDDLLAKMQED